MSRKIKVAMIGIGAISGIYLDNIRDIFSDLVLIGVCDLVRQRAEDAKDKYGIPKIYDTMHEAFADEEVDIVLNLTRPNEHFDVSLAALHAGKHLYTEKPLAASLEEGIILRDLAQAKGLMIAGAPDTSLGAGIQTCRRLIDAGLIGTPIGSAAFMICRGHEGWHPDPEFYYKHGGGPMMDMGPYYLTAMINMMGGISSVMSTSQITFPKRVISSKPLSGQVIDVDVSTYVAGTVRYSSGAIGTLFATFDVYYPGQARFEVYGSEGTLFVPDPNTFGGPVCLYRHEDKEIRELPLMMDYPVNSRGLGLADMAKALMSGRHARAGSQQIFHVLEVMEGFETSSKIGKWVDMVSHFERQEPMVRTEVKGILD